MRRSVDLSKQATVNKHGKRYAYWVIRWYDAAGKRRSQHVGRVDQLSKRQAENLRRQKEADLRSKPGRRNISRAPALAAFLEFYYAARATELAPGSLELNRQTGRYLQAFFGPDRRLDEVMRHDARAFKTALAAGDLMHANKRQVKPGPVTVALHIRNARTIFNRAVADDLIEYCPFDRLGSTPPVSRDWHYVSSLESAKLMAAATSPEWQLLLGLGRWAVLRRGEALNLRWHNVDWANNRLRVIGQDDWDVKDKDSRVVPICPELHELMLAAFDKAEEGEDRVIAPGKVSFKNNSRNFTFSPITRRFRPIGQAPKRRNRRPRKSLQRALVRRSLTTTLGSRIWVSCQTYGPRERGDGCGQVDGTQEPHDHLCMEAVRRPQMLFVLQLVVAAEQAGGSQVQAGHERNGLTA